MKIKKKYSKKSKKEKGLLVQALFLLTNGW